MQLLGLYSGLASSVLLVDLHHNCKKAGFEPVTLDLLAIVRSSAFIFAKYWYLTAVLSRELKSKAPCIFPVSL